MVVIKEGRPLQPKLADGDGSGCVASSSAGHVETLVYRAPGCHPGDLQHFTHVPPPPALRAMLKRGHAERQNLIIFSTRGAQPPADKLGGGDYDGDEFMVLHDQQIVGLTADAEVRQEPTDEPAATAALAPRVTAAKAVASQAASKALPESPTERTRQLTSLALDRKYNELDVLAKAAFNIMAQGDWYGVDDKQVAGPLVNCYYGNVVLPLLAPSLPVSSPLTPLAMLPLGRLSPSQRAWTLPRRAPPLDTSTVSASPSTPSGCRDAPRTRACAT